MRLGPVLAPTELLCVPSVSHFTSPVVVLSEPELGGAIRLEKPLLLCEEGCDWGQAGWALLPVFWGAEESGAPHTWCLSLPREAGIGLKH